MKKHLVAASALALVVAAGAAGLSLRGTSTSGKAHAGASAASAAAPSSVVDEAAPPVGERDLRLGRTFTYDVKATRALNDAELAKVDGRLVLTVVGAAEGGAAVRAALVTGGEHAEGLRTPFFFVIQPNGAIGSFGFPKAMPGAARRFLRSIVSALQVVAEPQPAWETHETDGAGELVARYTRSGDRLEKTVTRYDRIKTPTGLATPAELGAAYEPRGTSHFVLDASGWPASLTEDLTVTSTFEVMKLVLTQKTDARLASSGIDRTHVGSYAAARADFDPDVDALAEGAALAKEDADRNLVAGATLPTLLADVQAAKDARGRSRSVARMGALFRTSPAAVASAHKTLLAAATPEVTARAIASALGQVGTKEAQHALADALGSNETAATTKNEAAISLGLTEKPTSEAKEALAKGAKSADAELAETSSLALGNLARNAAGSADANDAVSLLLARLASATTPAEKALALDALGNAGDARALDAILASCADPYAIVRAAAVRALRFEKDERVVKALQGGAMDFEASVRMAALAAIGQQPLGPYLVSVEHLATRDADAEVRLLAVRVLARGVNTGGDVEAVLAAVAAKDPEAKVRDAATQALAKPTAPVVR